MKVGRTDGFDAGLRHAGLMDARERSHGDEQRHDEDDHRRPAALDAGRDPHFRCVVRVDASGFDRVYAAARDGVRAHDSGKHLHCLITQPTSKE